MKTIELTQGQVAKVSDHRFEYINQWKWRARWEKHTQSFCAIRINKEGKTVYMHREIMQTPKGMECDHKDHDTLNNQDDNLRNVTVSQNQMNRKVNSNNKLQEKCIYHHSQRDGYNVQVKKDKKIVYNKFFKNLADAIVARDEAVKKYHGEFAFL